MTRGRMQTSGRRKAMRPQACALALLVLVCAGAAGAERRRTQRGASPPQQQQGPALPTDEQPVVPELEGVSVVDAGVSVGGMPVSRSLASFLDGYKFSAPAAQLQRANVYAGPGQRLRGLLRAAMDGALPNNTLRVGVVGGSIAWGHGASQRGTNDFFSIFMAWLRRALPKVNVVARNGCVPGTPAVYMLACLDNHVDEEVDLLFLEYCLNDGFVDSVSTNARVRVMERLLRRALSLPRYPALVFMQMPSHGQAFVRAHPDWRPFHVTPEDQYGALALYYDLGWLSMRQAFLSRLGNGETGGETALGGARYMVADGLHPNNWGHKLMADAAVWMVQQAALGLLLRPAGAEERAYLDRKALPEPMHKGNHHPVSKLCLHELGLSAAVTTARGFSLVNEGSEAKTKWGYVARAPGAEIQIRVDTTAPVGEKQAAPGGGGGGGGDAAGGGEKSTGGDGGGEGSDGDGGGGAEEGGGGEAEEGGGGAEEEEGEGSGDKEAAAAGVDRGGGEQGQEVAVFVAHLKSYEHMGKAQVRCVFGCTCRPLVINAHHKLRESTTHLARVDGVTRHPACILRIVVLDQTDSGEHKFKVTGVMVSNKNKGDAELAVGHDAHFAAWDAPYTSLQHQRNPAPP